jgi:protein phosphatase
LALSRALGDGFLKQGGESQCGLIATPHCSEPVTLDPAAAAFAVLASDGLWDVASARDAVRIAAQAGAGAGAGGGAAAAAAALVAHARHKRSKDDVTVLVVVLCPDD